MTEMEKSKRRQILDTAARLFASKRFDEVKLDEIASESRLGKGTIYLYFKSKEELYAALIIDGLETLLAEVEEGSGGAGRGAWGEIESIVDALLAFAGRHPHLFALMRAGGGVEDARRCELRAKIATVCERAIRRGVESGELADPHPELTAQYVLSFVRVALLHGPTGVEEETLRRHILYVLGAGIRRDEGRQARVGEA